MKNLKEFKMAKLNAMLRKKQNKTKPEKIVFIKSILNKGLICIFIFVTQKLYKSSNSLNSLYTLCIILCVQCDMIWLQLMKHSNLTIHWLP